MQQLRSLEVLEIEILDLLNTNRILPMIYFGGGTMLRLCHNLNRYSTDLDFWLDISADSNELFDQLNSLFSAHYTVSDAANNKNTLLFEIKSPHVSRSLKIEIRKEQHNFEWERKIAFSTFTNIQVQVHALTLNQMMKNKVAAFLSRKIIRDCYDIEFLLTRGVALAAAKEELQSMLSLIDSFMEKDYKVILGSILEETDRRYYSERNFRLLKEEITKKLLE
ncbi:MAG: nucleotidyl transferase AbiEii/AbiGii toxin family protein [Candidatus Paceibacterota bacterium]